MAKNNSEYVLSLDAKNILILIVLFTLTSSLLFYLGMVYGKATRTIDEKEVVVRTLEKDSENILNDRSVIFDPSENDKTAADYEKKLSEILDKIETEKKIPENKESDNTEAQGNEKSQNIVSNNTQADSVNNKKNDSGFYTIQILATSSYEKANKLSNDLRKKNFETFISALPSDNGNIYRVRVGRSNRQEAEAVLKKIAPEIRELGEPKMLRVE